MKNYRALKGARLSIPDVEVSVGLDRNRPVVTAVIGP